jgi:hypothetical protein
MVAALVISAVLFVVSIIQITLIQRRIVAKHGLMALNHGRVKARDVYWRQLTIAQRLRLWAGIGVFLVFLFAQMLRQLFG